MSNVQRFAQIIQLKPESIAAYKKHHAEVWGEVLRALHQGNYRNYSIYLFEIPYLAILNTLELITDLTR